MATDIGNRAVAFPASSPAPRNTAQKPMMPRVSAQMPGGDSVFATAALRLAVPHSRGRSSHMAPPIARVSETAKLPLPGHSN